MFYLKEKLNNEVFDITEPGDLSSKPGGVIVTTAFYEPNYLSISWDKWVRSDGTVLTCEQLFDELSKYDCKLVYLSNYDFQNMD